MTIEAKIRFIEDSVKMIMEGPLSSPDPVMRVNGIMHLVNLGPTSVPIIVDRLDAMDAKMEVTDHLLLGTIRSLGLIGAPMCFDVLMKYLRSEKGPFEKELNDQVITACIRLGTADSMGGIIKRSTEVEDIDKYEPFEERFASIITSVYPDDIPDEVESEFLKILSMDLSKEVRLRVINIISTMDDVEMLDSLLYLLIDAEVEIRREIIKMIFQRRAVDYKEHLLKALEDTDEEVRALSIYGLMISDRSLGMDKVKEFIEALGGMKGDIPVMKEAESVISSYLIRTGKEAEPMLYKVIGSGDKGTKLLANRLLDRLK
jgi:HEAT repeat protein